MTRRSSLDRLLDSLFRAPHDYRPSTDLFPDIDPKKVAKELKLEERARERSFRKESLRPPGQLEAEADAKRLCIEPKANVPREPKNAE